MKNNINTLLDSIYRTYSPYYGNEPICKINEVSRVLRDRHHEYSKSNTKKNNRVPGVPSKFDIILEQEKRKLLTQ